jgi:hypothetical protein
VTLPASLVSSGIDACLISNSKCFNASNFSLLKRFTQLALTLALLDGKYAIPLSLARSLYTATINASSVGAEFPVDLIALLNILLQPPAPCCIAVDHKTSCNVFDLILTSIPVLLETLSAAGTKY